MSRILLFISVVLCVELVGQNQRIISYNLFDGAVDTLSLADFDTTIASEITEHYIGNFNSEINDLSEDVPLDNIFSGSSFTRKRQASLDFDINNYPIRTSVKLFKLENDSIKSKCSGSLISRKHVLTACHCVAEINNNVLLYDSLWVSPVWDNGLMNNNFESSWVKKIFIFENWNMYNTDFAVLELEKPIGEETGWLSIGFESNNSLLLDGIFYKFSYPANTILQLDSNLYNGDTLYYNYGVADILYENKIGVAHTNALPGESGSSLIKVQNNSYISYGVLSYSYNLSHSRFTNWKYYAIKSIISNDLFVSNKNDIEQARISIFPVPTPDFLNVIYLGKDELIKIKLFDSNGRKVIEKGNLTNELQLDLSHFPSGAYILMVYTDNRTMVKKIIKRGY